jgi:hypothetical protein
MKYVNDQSWGFVRIGRGVRQCAFFCCLILQAERWIYGGRLALTLLSA